MVVGAATAGAQSLPGAPSGGGPPPALTGPYGPEPAAPQPPARPPAPARIPRWLTVVPDLDLAAGYSDNVFITPDVLGFAPVSDGVTGVRPRLRWLVPLARTVGLVGDYGFNFQKYVENGEATVHAGTLFLGYRPVGHRHAEIGVRGARTRVSEFDPSDADEGHVFFDVTYGPNSSSTFGGGASFGVRDFPSRTRLESEALVLGLPLPLGPTIVLPGRRTTVRTGQEDRVLNALGRFQHTLTASTTMLVGYDFTRNDSELSTLDYWSHQLSVGVPKTWGARVGTEAAYTVRFRGFQNVAATSSEPRRDTIHGVTLGFLWAPAWLQEIPLTRSALLRLTYDLLLARSNVDTGEFDRNFVGATLQIGFRPFTGTQLLRTLLPGFGPPAPHRSRSSSAAP